LNRRKLAHRRKIKLRSADSSQNYLLSLDATAIPVQVLEKHVLRIFANDDLRIFVWSVSW
jgi:hypothetical protein